MFAKDNGFNTEQMSAWFSIIKSVHEMAVGECLTVLFQILFQSSWLLKQIKFQ